MPTPEEDFLNSPPTPLPEGTVDVPPEPEAVAEPEQQPAAEANAGKPEGEPEPKPEGDDKGKKETPWFQRRIDELTRQRHDEARRAEALQVENDRLRRAQQPQGEGQGQPQQPERGFTQDDIERRAAEIATQREFDRQCNSVYEDGVKQFPDFGDALGNFRLLGGLPPALVEAAVETGSGAAVLYELGKDPNEAARIMQMSPTRMAVAVAKLANKPAPAPAPISRAPAPIRPIAAGGGKPGPKSVDDMSMAEFAEYEAQRAAKRSA